MVNYNQEKACRKMAVDFTQILQIVCELYLVGGRKIPIQILLNTLSELEDSS